MNNVPPQSEPDQVRSLLRPWSVAVSASILTFLSRLPFLDAGYGIDPDAWRVIHSARLIADTGQYQMSRPPGYPIPEYLLSLFAYSDPWLVNLITACFSALLVYYFVRCYQHFELPHRDNLESLP